MVHVRIQFFLIVFGGIKTLLIEVFILGGIVSFSDPYCR